MSHKVAATPLKDEKTLGRYSVSILRQLTANRWEPDTMMLDATITNYRLMLRPLRRKYAPASLPGRYIRTVALTRHDKFHCVGLYLITDDYLALTLATGRLEHLHGNLAQMIAKPANYKIDEQIARNDIERLIHFFNMNANLPVQE